MSTADDLDLEERLRAAAAGASNPELKALLIEAADKIKQLESDVDDYRAANWYQ